MEFLQTNMAPVMFMGLIAFLLLGFPVAFSLGACGLFFGFIGIELGILPEALLQALPLRIFGIMQNETLLAIPFFTLMGLVLERSGMAEDLLDTIGQLFGPVRGGLALAVIFVGALLAATTGVVAASVISMGLISLPIMLRYGYDRRVASGVIAASGTLAQIIPPSLVLIILADQLGRSVGEMYKGAFLPGFMLMGMYVSYVVLVALIRPNWVPALPPEARTLRADNGNSGLPSLLVLTVLSVGASLFFATHIADVHTWWSGELVTAVAKDETIVVSMCVGVTLAFVLSMLNKVTGLGLLSRMAERVTFVLIPPLLLIFLVLGTIFLGVATPTEGGAMGAVGAILMATVRARLNLSLLKQALMSTTRLSCFVVFILIGSTIFSLVFQGVDGSRWVEHLLTGLPGGQIGFLILVNILIFILAFFLDFFELSFIVVPLLAPVAQLLGIDLVWFGVLLAVNMQTSFMHPPFGFALFYLRSVAPAVPYTDRVTKKLIQPITTMQIYWGAVPFVVIQVIMVGLIIAFPGIVSSGLEKKEVYDMDAIRLQMENQMQELDFQDAGPPESNLIEASPDSPGANDDPAAGEAQGFDDPLKDSEQAIVQEKK
ncbi:TRAP transporter large permease [Rhodoferax antarcticus]|uniref:TRAP dicarboxylate transporter, DctM subunit n=1 Tax=Rhodoferax antarcticus ANT.BR TaxID=1111071 RepID=A0A1Q8YDB8_9BURK|nr:TRAP transporter large permease subunit [Rhodoferax antarcticus]APW45922.1 C4-dicarboxylate ABC transporter [Rhodoferax antarcticus]OLP06034.1 TRAP dicarboxylate transporter, DctM subunit [Rhodoferax antarcticus ANT.BR]